ncbi:hypothetical protein O6H91_21G027800 [Diphasiastrum complanatum]|uniref:Uncharacterized protein n=1 Tax=Diphasiastrum complanatum TaxID=34168 RepID=A0ACC2AJ84_DIPCM|nr:hypothetical protein O6H91_21G027800 [Diphasiastrum complanatum]
MPGLVIYRTLASASRGNKVTGNHALMWPRPGKQQDEDLPFPQPQPKTGLVFPLQGLTSGISEIEHALLTDVSNAMTYVKEEGIDFCNEGTECNRGYFKIRAIMKHLRAAGYHAAICKSELYHAGGFPTGEYEYMDVIETCNSAPQRLIVDFQFRAQFEIARPTDEYSAILGNLPSIFVGEADRLLQIVNVMSDAVKKSLKKNGMYLPPWRKPDYIKAKWFSAYRRTTQNTGPHIKNNDTIVSQDFRRDSKFTNAMELQYQKAGARQAIQELYIDELCIFNPKGSLKRSQPDELNGISISRNNCCFDGDKTIFMVTDWQPPLANGRGSGKACKIAGLASALMEAGLTTLSKQQNTINQENNFALPVSRAVAMA